MANKMRHKYIIKRTAALVLLAAALAVRPAFAEDALTLASVPEAGASLQPGDTVTFTFYVQDTSLAAGWGAIRVSMAEGLVFQPETIQCSVASVSDGVYDVVPGNDGFLMLPDHLQPGDSVSFEAVAAETGGMARCALETDMFSLEALLTVALPEALPDATMPATGTEQATFTPVATVWLYVVVCMLLLAAILTMIFCRNKLKTLYQNIKGRSHAKKQVADDEAPVQQHDDHGE